MANAFISGRNYPGGGGYDVGSGTNSSVWARGGRAARLRRFYG